MREIAKIKQRSSAQITTRIKLRTCAHLRIHFGRHLTLWTRYPTISVLFLKQTWIVFVWNLSGLITMQSNELKVFAISDNLNLACVHLSACMLYKFHSKKNNLLSASCKRQWANEKKLSTDVLQARF